MTSPCTLLRQLLTADRRAAAKLANLLKHAVTADPAAIAPCRALLLQAAEECTDLRVRWNLLATLAALPWKGAQRARVLALAWSSLEVSDPFTRVHALELLFQLARGDASLERQIIPVLDLFEDAGTASMRARARSVRKRLARASE